MLGASARTEVFQSTLSVRRATPQASGNLHHLTISIHALREESDFVVIPFPLAGYISIHALREESDYIWAHYIGDSGISIHALREESDD